MAIDPDVVTIMLLRNLKIYFHLAYLAELTQNLMFLHLAKDLSRMKVINKKKAFTAAKAEPTFRGTLLKKSIKMEGE